MITAAGGFVVRWHSHGSRHADSGFVSRWHCIAGLGHLRCCNDGFCLAPVFASHVQRCLECEALFSHGAISASLGIAALVALNGSTSIELMVVFD